MLPSKTHRNHVARGASRLAALSLLLASCGGTAETAGTEAAVVDTPAKHGLELPPDDPILGSVLVIDGKIVPHEVIRRQVVLGSVGVEPIEMAKLQIFIDEEIQRQVAEGASSEAFVVDDQDVDQTIEETKLAIQSDYEEPIDFDELGMERDALAPRARLEAKFRRVFMPENPSDYPPTTLLALSGSEDGKSILEYVKSTYDQRVVDEQSGNKNVVGDRMIEGLLMDKVVDYLTSTAVIESSDAVPVDVVMRVNGKDIAVDQIWRRIKDKVSPVDVQLAKRWIVDMTLLERALKAEGAWLTPEEAAAAYEEHSAPFKDSLFSIERMAVSIKRFPSVEAYKQYYRVYESYKRMIADELTTDNLKAFGDERTKMLVGLTRVDVDVILLSAFDFKKGQWKPDGWADAERRANEALRLLVEEGRPWDEVMDDCSDFYDPPTPKSQKDLPEKSLNNGRFRGRPRNQLMGMLGESDYWQFLYGDCLTDYIFFDQEVGKVEGPLRGPWGWYIPKLISRKKNPLQSISDQDTFMTMVEQDYIMTHLGKYTQELLAENTVTGL